MIVKILGYENTSYTKKDTGELVECLELHYSKKFKGENSYGEAVGAEYINAKAFPEQFREIVNAKEKIIGKLASISKDTRTFKGNAYAVLDEFELLK